MYTDVSVSIDYPYESPKGVVRAEVVVSGFIVEKTSETTSKVVYVSDTDLKGSIPSFVKKMVVED